MTSEKMRQVLVSAIKRSPDRTPEVLADRILRAIEVVVEAEELMGGGTEPVAERPAAKEEPPVDWPLNLQDKTPPSPSVTTTSTVTDGTVQHGIPAPGLIVLPDSPEAKQILDKRRQTELDRVTPIRASKVAKPPNGDDEPKWEIYDLNKFIHQNSPPQIQITVQHPSRGPVTLTLERNVMMGIGLDAVKLIYKHPACNDDMSVIHTFWCSQMDLDIPGAIAKLKQNALHIYRPRPRVLAPMAPVRPPGPMTFNESDPHDSTDKLFDPNTGSWF